MSNQSRRKNGWLAAALLLWALVGFVRAEEGEEPAKADEAVKAVEPMKEDVAKVLRLTGPGVVTIETTGIFSAGILLNADGLVLTTTRAVGPRLSLRVRVHTVVDGKPEAYVYKKVVFVGYYPDYDLALVKIDPKEHKVPLVSLKLSKDKPQVGQRTYAVGTARQEATSATPKVVAGTITANAREYEKSIYYESAGSYHLEHVGGPLVNEAGEVLGIVAFKLSPRGPLILVDPVKDLDLAKFIPPSKWVPARAKGQAQYKMGAKLSNWAKYVEAKEGKGSDKARKVHSDAAICYTDALTCDPENSLYFFALGQEMVHLRYHQIAAPYLARAIQLGPWDQKDGRYYRVLGQALWGLKEKTVDLVLQEGITRFPGDWMLWDFLAERAKRRKDWSALLYHATAAFITVPPLVERSIMHEDWQTEARKNLGSGEALTQAETQAEPAKVLADLQRLDEAAAVLHKKQERYTTPGFQALIEELAGPGDKGPLKTVPVERQRVPTTMPAHVKASKPASTSEKSDQ